MNEGRSDAAPGATPSQWEINQSLYPHLSTQRSASMGDLSRLINNQMNSLSTLGSPLHPMLPLNTASTMGFQPPTPTTSSASLHNLILSLTSTPSSFPPPPSPLSQPTPQFGMDFTQMLQQQIQLQQTQQLLQFRQQLMAGASSLSPLTSTVSLTSNTTTTVPQSMQSIMAQSQQLKAPRPTPIMNNLPPTPPMNIARVPPMTTHSLSAPSSSTTMPPPKLPPPRITARPVARKPLPPNLASIQPGPSGLNWNGLMSGMGQSNVHTNHSNLNGHHMNNRNNHLLNQQPSTSAAIPAKVSARKPSSNGINGTSPTSSLSASSSTSSPPFEMGKLPTDNYMPTHFMRGTIIQLANGKMKKVEDMNTDDFIISASMASYLTMEKSVIDKIDCSGPLAKIRFFVGSEKSVVNMEYQTEHPFFVVGHGWSSCDPVKTMNVYGLHTQQLQSGDICISLTRKKEDIHAKALDSAVSITKARKYADKDAAVKAIRDTAARVNRKRKATVCVEGGKPASGRRSAPLSGQFKEEKGIKKRRRHSSLSI